MGVSKQDWANYYANTWVSGEVRTTYDQLIQAIEAFEAAIASDDLETFLAYTEGEGGLYQAAMKAENAASDAVRAIQRLALEGNQKRFAKQSVITTYDSARMTAEAYYGACDLLFTGLVRGIQPDHDSAKDARSLDGIRNGDLRRRIRSDLSPIVGCFADAQSEIGRLAAVDKIGRV